MDYIQDEGTLHSLISILVCLMPVFEKKSSDPDDIKQNPILSEFVEKEDLYREKMLHLTNRGSMYRMDKICKCLNILIKKEACQDYFNKNDLNLLFDILLRNSIHLLVYFFYWIDFTMQ